MARTKAFFWCGSVPNSIHDTNMEVEPPVITKNILFANKKETLHGM